MRNYQTGSPTAYQRRPEYQKGDDWIKEFLHRSLVAHIAHVADGQAFITPTNFWYDETRQRIIFHSNVAGRLRSNLVAVPRVCLETSEMGRFLPANSALEFSVQYRSVMVFGTVNVLEDLEDMRVALTSLIAKYFPRLRPGVEFRPITDKELARTTVYSLGIDSWSGKENWQQQADMIDDWPALPEELL